MKPMIRLAMLESMLFESLISLPEIRYDLCSRHNMINQPTQESGHIFLNDGVINASPVLWQIPPKIHDQALSFERSQPT
jgi:hypothetical protein